MDVALDGQHGARKHPDWGLDFKDIEDDSTNDPWRMVAEIMILIFETPPAVN